MNAIHFYREKNVITMYQLILQWKKSDFVLIGLHFLTESVKYQFTFHNKDYKMWKACFCFLKSFQYIFYKLCQRQRICHLVGTVSIAQGELAVSGLKAPVSVVLLFCLLSIPNAARVLETLCQCLGFLVKYAYLTVVVFSLQSEAFGLICYPSLVRSLFVNIMPNDQTDVFWHFSIKDFAPWGNDSGLYTSTLTL